MGNDFDREGESLTKKPDGKRLRASGDRLRRGKETHLRNRASLDWRLDQRNVCDKNGFEADIVPTALLQETLLKSRTGQAIFEELAQDGVDIVYDMQSVSSQYYPRQTGKHVITLNPYRPAGDLLNLLSRELRRAWQHRKGALVNPLNFEPDEAILVNRAQQADVLMIAIRIAWELKLAGEHAAWEYLTASSMADVSRTFENKAREDFRTLNNGAAARLTYDKFFEDSRTKVHDKKIIHQMLLDESGYIKSQTVREKVSMDLFAKLGELPHGRNYLSAAGSRLPTDMCYATVEDRSNANFLWFIKFERSFQEKELKMVQESVRLSAEIVDFAKWSQDRNDPGRTG